MTDVVEVKHIGTVDSPGDYFQANNVNKSGDNDNDGFVESYIAAAISCEGHLLDDSEGINYSTKKKYQIMQKEIVSINFSTLLFGSYRYLFLNEDFVLNLGEYQLHARYVELSSNKNDSFISKSC